MNNIEQSFQQKGYIEEFSGDSNGHHAKLMFDTIKRSLKAPDTKKVANMYEYSTVDDLKKCLYDAKKKVNGEIFKDKKKKLLLCVTPHVDVINKTDAICFITYEVDVVNTESGLYESSYKRIYKFNMCGFMIEENAETIQNQIIKYRNKIEEQKTFNLNNVIDRLQDVNFTIPDKQEFEVKKINNKSIKVLKDTGVMILLKRIYELQEDCVKEYTRSLQQVSADIIKRRCSYIKYIIRYCLSQTMSVTKDAIDDEIYEINIDKIEEDDKILESINSPEERGEVPTTL